MLAFNTKKSYTFLNLKIFVFYFSKMLRLFDQLVAKKENKSRYKSMSVQAFMSSI